MSSSDVSKVFSAPHLRHINIAVAPWENGPAWEFHPYRQHILFRNTQPRYVRCAAGVALLAQSNDIGTGVITAVPTALVGDWCKIMETFL